MWYNRSVSNNKSSSRFSLCDNRGKRKEKNMKNVFRNSLKLALIVAIVVTFMVPTVAVQAQVLVVSSSSYEEYTPQEEKELEKFYWRVLFSQMHIAPAYYNKHEKDALILEDEAQISAMIILDEMLAFPAGEPGDVSAINRQRDWAEFYWRIASGKTSRYELRKQLKIVRDDAMRYGIPLW